MSLKVDEVMVKTVITLDAGSTVKEAVALMNQYEIGCLVINYDGKPVGIVTERDMLRRVLLETKNPETTKVSQIMTAPLITGEPKMNLQEAIRLMVEKKIKKLPILENGHLIGLITLTDLVRSIAYLEHVFSGVPNHVPAC